MFFEFIATEPMGLSLCIGVARGVKGHGPKFLAYLVILCSERQCPKQNTVARLKSKYLAPQKILGRLRDCA